MANLQAIQSWLQSSYSVQVPPDWLAACVEWIQQESGGQTESQGQLQTLVFEQWLMSDLRELGASCLPPDLASCQCVQLSGQFVLQVDSIVNIGVPLYGQLQKVKGTLNANSEVSADHPQQPAWEPKPTRMMLLKMTDGQTDVKGMEYRPIPDLNQNLQPGFKVVVHGQLTCRRGVLMLTADNLQILGGEVDSLIEANTPVAVLEQAMDANSLNNGKHERKEFSGRFLNKKDFKQKVVSHTQNTHQGNKYQAVVQQQTSAGNWGRRSANQPAVKRETPALTTDDWEDDFDYKGILEEPMDEQSALFADTASTIHPHDVKPIFRNPLPPGSSAAPFQPTIRPAEPQCKKESITRDPEQRMSDMWNAKVKTSLSQQSNGVMTAGPGPSQPVTVKPETSMFEDTAWDDDDFAFEAGSSLSPIIPVQGQPNGGHMQSSSKSLPSSVFSHGEPKRGLNGISPQTFPAPQPKTGSKLVLPAPRRANNVSSVMNTGLSRGNSEDQSSQLRPNNPVQRSSSINTVPSSPRSVPPPAKQRKLTSMLSVFHKDTKNSSDSSRPLQNLKSENNNSSDCEIVFGEGRALSAGLREDGGHKAVNNSITGRLASTQGELDLKPPDTRNIFQRNGHNMENDSRKVKGGKPLETAVMVGDATETGENEHNSFENHTLQDVQRWLSTASEGEVLFTIKGYITTLTDRLRSGDGVWSLSCRITDEESVLEVAVADSVVTTLIGFSAKESMKLRQQARKDPEIKNYLSESIQKCQSALAEFSGLMDIKVKAGEQKPHLINMVLLEKKQRQLKQ